MQIDWFRIPEGEHRGAVYVVNNRRHGLGFPPSAAGAMPPADRANYLGSSRYQQAQGRLGWR